MWCTTVTSATSVAKAAESLWVSARIRPRIVAHCQKALLGRARDADSAFHAKHHRDVAMPLPIQDEIPRGHRHQACARLAVPSGERCEVPRPTFRRTRRAGKSGLHRCVRLRYAGQSGIHRTTRGLAVELSPLALHARTIEYKSDKQRCPVPQLVSMRRIIAGFQPNRRPQL
jgi:hypothetical protein